jgi:hypothetical protein
MDTEWMPAYETAQFRTGYCDERGAYDWVKFVEHSSCDFDLNAFQPKP